MEKIAEEAYEGLVHLWHEVFEDDREFIEYYLDNFATTSNIFYEFKESRLTGMAHAPLFETKLGAIPYLYAVAVEEDARGKGIATNLINAVLKRAYANGALACFTIPADDDLRVWYDHVFQFCTLPNQQIIKFFCTPEFDFGGDTEEENIPAIRILDVEEYLKRFIDLNPTTEIDINVTDPLIPENQAHYSKIGSLQLKKDNFDKSQAISISRLYKEYPIPINEAVKQ